MTPVDAGLIRLLLDHAEQMILFVEPEGLQVVLANQVAQQRLGYSEDELRARSILDIESALQDVFFWEEVRAGNCSPIEAQEGLYACADGTMLTVEKSVRLLEYAGQRFLLVQAREVHEERRIEDDLANTSSQLRATLESTGNGILVIDWQGNVASMNRLFSRMWGLPEELLLRGHDTEIVDYIVGQVEEGDLFRAHLRQIVESQDRYEELHLRDGRITRDTDRAGGIEGGNGRVHGVVLGAQLGGVGSNGFELELGLVGRVLGRGGQQVHQLVRILAR